MGRAWPLENRKQTQAYLQLPFIFPLYLLLRGRRKKLEGPGERQRWA